MMKKLIFLMCFLCLFKVSYAETFYPAKDFKDDYDPIADKMAEFGGQIQVYSGQYPRSLNAYLDNNSFSSELFSTLYETLIVLNPLTLEYEPNIAEKWSISDDKKTITFYIDKNAKWSNGEEIDAYDVKWTFEAIINPKNLTGATKLILERFNPPEIIDKYTIRFEAKSIHWRNLMALGGMNIMPKKTFEAIDFNKLNFEFPVVSGPYKIFEIKEGILISLKKRADWWQINKKRSQNTNNFEFIKYKFFAENENAFESFKKGLIDIYPVYTAQIWANETKGSKFIQNYIIKQKVFNKNPIGFQGFAMNTRIFPFNDLKTRIAMNYLLDREKMNATLMNNQYFLHKSYFEDLYSKEIECPNKEFYFDKEIARQLLKEAGWVNNPKTGFLEKDGKKFSFKFLSRSASTDKFLSIYSEDLKDLGIELVVEKKDWASWLETMDNFNFQMTWAAWSSSVFKDPESMWASSQASVKGGHNVTGFKNSIADEIIERQKTIFSIQERNKLLIKLDKIIYDECPYVLLWNINYTRLLYWNKFGTPKSILSKYGDNSSAVSYWWLDNDANIDLEEAMKEKRSLLAKPEIVHFE